MLPVRDSRIFQWLSASTRPEEGIELKDLKKPGNDTTKDRKDPIAQARSYYAQALVLFNVYGIPLSFAPYLEYYYATAYPTTRLPQISLIIALQILCIHIAPYPTWLIYQRFSRSPPRLSIFLTTLVTIAAQACLLATHSYLTTLILQGPLLGLTLGALYAFSSMTLASHYNHNLALTTTHSTIGIFLGALTHTAVTWTCLRLRALHSAHGWSVIVSSMSLLLASFLAKPDPSAARSRPRTDTMHANSPSLKARLLDPVTIGLILAYTLIYTTILIPPIYTVLFLSSSSANHFPDTGARVLLFMFGAACVSAPACANQRVSRYLGPVTCFSAACLFAGVSLIGVTWVPVGWVATLSGVAYGMGLGVVVTLRERVVGVLCEEEGGERQVGMFMWSGVCAAAGIVASAVVLERTDAGMTIISIVCIAGLVAGGSIVVGVGWLRGMECGG